VADLDVVIFTFTDTEFTAVRSLLNSYLDPNRADSPPWRVAFLGGETITRTFADGRTAQIEHKPLRAQGNVTAAAELARAAYGIPGTRDPQADYYIFYGCCGALDEELIGEAFRVSRVAYLSLGSVTNGASQARQLVTNKPEPEPAGSKTPANEASEVVIETVKLKNKWIVRTDPDNQQPLSSIPLPTGSKDAPGPLMFLNLPDAFVLATDKVIKIPPAENAPKESWIEHHGGPVYNQDEWTYGQALAHCKKYVPGPILIDMETFGIASTMRAMGLRERVLVLRVVTDALTNKAGQPKSDQLDMLHKQLPVLDEVLTTIMKIADDAT
jgi:hypothetical protein